MIENMDNSKDFLAAFNKKQQEQAEPGTVTRPFICKHELLTLAEREELTYRYTYLDESIEALALYYRLAPAEVKSWIKQHCITRKSLDTEEDLQNFEAHVNQTYKSVQIRMLGLTALNTAKSWQALAIAEDDILASLKNASAAVAKQQYPDPRTISSLAATHDKLITRHEIIQKGLEGVESLIGALKEEFGFEVEVTHVEAQPKSKPEGEE